jgi:hypothetical protein
MKRKNSQSGGTEAAAPGGCDDAIGQERRFPRLAHGRSVAAVVEMAGKVAGYLRIENLCDGPFEAVVVEFKN